MNGPVLVTGARAPVALDIARALRAAGREVHLADCVTPFAARGLSPHTPIHRFAAPSRDFARFRRDMTGLVGGLGVRFVVPTCEEVFWLAAAAEADGWADRLFAPDLSLLRRLHSKYEFAALAAEIGLDAPETQVFAGPVELATPELFVLKPEFSRFATHTLVGPDAAAVRALKPTPQRRWVAQRRIEGEEFCCWAAVHGGRVVAYSAYRPRWRLGRAAAFQMEAVNMPAVEHVARRVAEATGLTGQIAFDVMVDGQERAWPLECNPRAVSGVHLFDACAALGRAILDGEPAPSPPQGRLRHLAPAMALLGVPSALAAGRLSALLEDWQASADVIGRGSPMALAGCLVDAARFAAVAFVKGITPAGATTDDIEWDGEPIA